MAKEIETTNEKVIKIGTSEFNDWSQVLGGWNTASRAQYRLACKGETKITDKAAAKAELLANIDRMQVTIEMLRIIAKDIEV